MLSDVKADELTTTDVLLLDTMNQQMLERVQHQAQDRPDRQVRDRRGKVFAIGEGLLPKETYIKQGALWDDRARAYWAHMGFSNQVGLLKYALTQAGVKGLSLPEPQPSLDFGYYYPGDWPVQRTGVRGRVRDEGSALRTGQRVFATWDEFDAWRQQHGKLRPGAPRIAVSFYKATYYSDETELLDAVIAEDRAAAAPKRSRCSAIPARSPRSGCCSIRRQAARRRGARLQLQFRRARRVELPGEGRHAGHQSDQPLRTHRAGVARVAAGPVDVRRHLQGGDAGARGHDRADGRRQPGEGQGSGNRSDDRRAQADASQVALAVRRADEYAALRSKANRDKRVAIVFYNYPAGKANIGASYLNVAESIANILQRLKQEGYDVGTGGSLRRQRAEDAASRSRATSAATRRASSRRWSRRAAPCGSASPSTRRWLDALSRRR